MYVVQLFNNTVKPGGCTDRETTGGVFLSVRMASLGASHVIS